MADEFSTREAYFSHYFEELRRGDADNAFHGLIETDGWVIPKVIEAFHAESDPNIRSKLVGIVAEYRRPDAVDFLVQALSDPSELVWKKALDGFVAIGTERSLASLRDS
jgi:HEAT repeat protein